MTFPLHMCGESGYFTELASAGIIRSAEIHGPRALRAREAGQQGLEIVLHLLYNPIRLGSHCSSPLANGWRDLPSTA
jgi:hypothetical protein